MKKGCCLGILPGDMEIEARLALAKDVGFDGVEPGTIRKKSEVKALKKAAENTGIEITSIMNSDHWGYPLSSPKKSVVAKSIKGMITSMENAAALGTDCVLLVPAVVTPDVSYEEAWKRSRAAIRKMIPTARKLGVVIAVENVWNKFLLSPIEFKAYVDSFKSQWVAAYFDVGNILLYGYPQQWIRTLGRRIKRVHLKDFDLDQELRAAARGQPRLAGGPPGPGGCSLQRLAHGRGARRRQEGAARDQPRDGQDHRGRVRAVVGARWTVLGVREGRG